MFKKNITTVFDIAKVALALVLTVTATLNILGSRSTEVLGVVSGKEGYKLRYQDVIKGGIVYTGNTVCLSESTDYGSCGTFTTKTNSTDNLFKPKTGGTTSDWKKNSASSILEVPKNSKIVYAELIWGGNYTYLDKDLTNELNKGVELIDAKGKKHTIKPDNKTAGEITTTGSYVRSKEVTDIINKAGSGSYTVGSIPSALIKNNPYSNYAGYTLAVAYANDKEPERSLHIFVGAEQVGADQLTNTVEVNGLVMPKKGKMDGRLFVSAGEGDSILQGDRIRVGHVKNKLTDLSGPNNRVNNFFASQINGNDGKIEVNGTQGKKNQPINRDSAVKRQGWDITTVSIANKLEKDKDSFYAQGYSKGDSYVINSLALQIDVDAANPEAKLKIKEGEGEEYLRGQTITYELIVKNNGSATSIENVVSGFDFGKDVIDKNSFKVNGKKVSYNNGKISLPDLDYNQEAKIEFKVKIAETKKGEHNRDLDLDYSYKSTNGSNKTSNQIESNESTYILVDEIKETNEPPVANNDSSKTLSNVNLITKVLVNDTDDNGLDEDSLTIVEQPKFGKVEIVGGEIKYTPNKDYVGKDNYSYKVCDQDKLCDEAIVSIDVESTFPPIANNDEYSTNVDESIIMDIFNNDSDKYEDVKDLDFAYVSQPKNGSVTRDKDKFLYTPKKGFYGQDKFEYEICNKLNLCDKAIVIIDIIAPVKQDEIYPPVAKDDAYKVDSSKTVITDVLNNDTDTDDNIDESTLKVVKNPEFGEVKIQDGEVIYTAVKEVTKSTDKFTYEICDKDGLCDQAEAVLDLSNILDKTDDMLGGGSVIVTDPVDDTKTSDPDTNTNTNNTDNTNTNTTNPPKKDTTNTSSGPKVVKADPVPDKNTTTTTPDSSSSDVEETFTFGKDPFSNNNSSTFKNFSSGSTDVGLTVSDTNDIAVDGLSETDDQGQNSLVVTGGNNMYTIVPLSLVFMLGVYGVATTLHKSKEMEHIVNSSNHNTTRLN